MSDMWLGVAPMMGLLCAPKINNIIGLVVIISLSLSLYVCVCMCGWGGGEDLYDNFNVHKDLHFDNE